MNRLIVGLILATFLLSMPLLALPAASGQRPGNWVSINNGIAGNSFSPQTQINRDNVDFIELQWLFPFSELESLVARPTPGAMAPPIVVDGIVYTVKNSGQILAFDAATGEVLWTAPGYSDVDWDGMIEQFPFMRVYSGHVHSLYYLEEQGWLMYNNSPCFGRAWNIEDGSVAWEIGVETLCGTNAEMGNPVVAAADPSGRSGIGSLGNQGYMGTRNHPPAFIGDIMMWPSMGSSGRGGRSSIIGIDMSNPQSPNVLWRTWLMPPAEGDSNWAIDACTNVNGNGWYFEAPRFFEESDYKGTRCTDVPDDVVRDDWINKAEGSPHFGKVHTASAATAIWGHMPVDVELGLVYLGLGDVGPYPNATYRYGPNLYGSGIVAMNAASGEIEWWYMTNPHDLWDQDCSWNGMLGEAAGRPVFIKGCKNGIVYVLDRATGEPVHIFESPTNWRTLPGWKWGVDANGDTRAEGVCCRMTVKDMSQGWINAPDLGPVIGPQAWAYLESDIGYDPVRGVVYAGTFNAMRIFQTGNVQDFGNQGSTLEGNVMAHNATVNAYNLNTGEIDWMYGPIEGGGFRGGILTTGDMVITYMNDGAVHIIDADTGLLIRKLFFGHPVNSMPTIGADSNGDFKIFLYIGGGGSASRFHPNADVARLEGALAAYGLPADLPIAPEVEQEVMELEDQIAGLEGDLAAAEEAREAAEAGAAGINPVSYVVIGLGVVLVVIAGVLFTRRRST